MVVLCDFDGTIVEADTCIHILDRFSAEDWRIADAKYEKGEISLEDCLRTQFSRVTANKHQIMRTIKQISRTRKHFETFVEYCRTEKIPIIVVSAGLDFVIKHFLEVNCWSDYVQVYSPCSRFTDEGISLTFPKLLHQASTSFKDDLVRDLKQKGATVLYVGDGTPDYEAAQLANYPIAIKNSKLAQLLNDNQIPFKEITTFREVLTSVVKANEQLLRDTANHANKHTNSPY